MSASHGLFVSPGSPSPKVIVVPSGVVTLVTCLPDFSARLTSVAMLGLRRCDAGLVSRPKKGVENDPRYIRFGGGEGFGGRGHKARLRSVYPSARKNRTGAATAHVRNFGAGNSSHRRIANLWRQWAEM
jgi:hypothetical protein